MAESSDIRTERETAANERAKRKAILRYKTVNGYEAREDCVGDVQIIDAERVVVRGVENLFVEGSQGIVVDSKIHTHRCLLTDEDSTVDPDPLADPSDAEVEAAAKALMERERETCGQTFSGTEAYIDLARATVTAFIQERKAGSRAS